MTALLWRRTGTCVSWLLFALLLGIVWVTPGRGQDLDRRVQTLEEAHPDRRLSVIETRLDSIEYIGKGILVVVLAQLALKGLEFRGRKSDR
jgi:hypothetical protein